MLECIGPDLWEEALLRPMDFGHSFSRTLEADERLETYARLGLPCSIAGITAETYKRARDEITVHRDGLLRAPLPSRVGECAYADEISDDEIELAFARLMAFT